VLVGRLVAPTAGGGGHRSARAWDVIAAWTQRWRRVILTSALVLTAAGLVVGVRLKAGADPLNYLPDDSPLVRDWRAIEARFGSPSPLTLDVAIDPALRLHPIDVLRMVDAIQQYVNGYPSIRATQSVVDWQPVLLDLRQPFDALPAPLRDVAPRLRTADGSRFAIYARYDVARHDLHHRLQRDLDAFVRDTFGRGVSVTVTGILVLIRESERELMRVLIWSLLAATAVILGMLYLVVGSARLMVVAVLPTVAPVLITVGVMALMGTSADPGTVTVAAVALGLAVDHTIHLLCAYRERRVAGDSAAVSGALRDCGGAVTLTSLASAAGFAMFAVSRFRPVMRFGVFLGLAMLLSLAAAVVLLPALLHVAGRPARRSIRVRRARSDDHSS